MMSELWEQAYCINLERRTDRREQMTEEFAKVDFDVEFWKATDWKTLAKFNGDRMTKKVPREHNILGHVACGISHYGALKQANDDQRYSVAIFEDDVLFSPNTNTVLAYVVDELPYNWQFLYLGYRPYKSLDAIVPWDDHVVRVNKCYDAHAYVVRQPLLQQLVETWDPYRLTTDWMYHEIKERYGTFPTIANQNKMLESEMEPNNTRLL